MNLMQFSRESMVSPTLVYLDKKREPKFDVILMFEIHRDYIIPEWHIRSFDKLTKSKEIEPAEDATLVFFFRTLFSLPVWQLKEMKKHITDEDSDW